MQIHCTTPAKLLLTGEHAVLNGIPALSLAIDLKTHAQLQFTPQKTNSLQIELTDYQQQHLFPFPLWQSLAISAEARYQNFLNHHLDIHAVLKTPVDLILLTFYHFHQQHPLNPGHWHLKLNSEIWPNRGLGSSASIIISLISALNLAHNTPLSLLKIKQLAQHIESRQHGQSSGVDTHTVLLGGLIQYQRTPDHTTKIDTLPQHPLKGYLIDTGKADNSTGEAVQQVQQQFPKDHPIWQQFNQVAQQMIQAWHKQSGKALKEQIRKNQALLEQIGIVPPKVANFIHQLHQIPKTAAKICGSGSLQGDKAGVVLCLSPSPPEALCQQWGYRWQKIKVSPHGIQCTHA